MRLFRALGALILLAVIAAAAIAVSMSFPPAKKRLDRYPRVEAAVESARDWLSAVPTQIGDAGIAAWTADDKRIVFAGSRFTLGGKRLWSLYHYDADTGQVARFGDFTGPDPIAAIDCSSSGETIAVEFAGGAGSYVMLYKPETNTFVQLPSAPGVSSGSQTIAESPLAFYPDGGKLVFIARSRRGRNICIYDDTTGKTGVVPVGTDVADATWSASGDRILFLADRGKKIVTANPDGGDPSVLIDSGDNWYPRFSPFGKMVAFFQTVQHRTSTALGVIAVDGESLSYYRGLPNDADGLSWSSDGRTIYFEARNAPRPWEIFAYSLDSHSTTQLTVSGSNVNPQPSHLGDKVLYEASGMFPGLHALSTITTDGSSREKLSGFFLP